MHRPLGTISSSGSGSRCCPISRSRRRLPASRPRPRSSSHNKRRHPQRRLVGPSRLQEELWWPAVQDLDFRELNDHDVVEREERYSPL